MNLLAGAESGAGQAMSGRLRAVMVPGGTPLVGDHLDRPAGGHDDAMAIAERELIRWPPGRRGARTPTLAHVRLRREDLACRAGDSVRRGAQSHWGRFDQKEQVYQPSGLSLLVMGSTSTRRRDHELGIGRLVLTMRTPTSDG